MMTTFTGRSNAGNALRNTSYGHSYLAALGRMVGFRLKDDTSDGQTVRLCIATERLTELNRMLPIWSLGPQFKVEILERLSEPSSGDPFILLIDLESFGGVDPVVDFLIAFRCSHSAVPVIIVSENFYLSEASPERRFVCDFSLRIPCQPSALTESFAMIGRPSIGHSAEPKCKTGHIR